MSNKIFMVVAAIIVVIIGIIVFNKDHKSSTAAAHKQTGSLSSLNTGSAPWPAESDHLTNRMQAIGIALLPAEAFAQHIHAHLDVYIDGTPVTVPANIGVINTGISPVHTHDTSGIIHIESADAHATYTLKQFFDLWGVKFTNDSIGSYKNDSTNKLVVYDNGAVVTKPADLKIVKHDEIAVVYGTAAEQPSIPKSFTFTNGL